MVPFKTIIIIKLKFLAVEKQSTSEVPAIKMFRKDPKLMWLVINTQFKECNFADVKNILRNVFGPL